MTHTDFVTIQAENELRVTSIPGNFLRPVVKTTPENVRRWGGGCGSEANQRNERNRIMLGRPPRAGVD